MSGRVVAIEPLLRLDLSSLAASETSRVVLARAVDVVSADEATLRVAVIAVDQFAVTPAQFFVELRPVVLGDGPEGDWIGDVVAEAAIDEKAVGKLVIAAAPEPIGTSFQIAVRGTQNATPGPLVLVASVDVVLKEGPVATEASIERSSRERRRARPQWSQFGPPVRDRARFARLMRALWRAPRRQRTLPPPELPPPAFLPVVHAEIVRVDGARRDVVWSRGDAPGVERGERCEMRGRLALRRVAKAPVPEFCPAFVFSENEPIWLGGAVPPRRREPPPGSSDPAPRSGCCGSSAATSWCVASASSASSVDVSTSPTRQPRLEPMSIGPLPPGRYEARVLPGPLAGAPSRPSGPSDEGAPPWVCTTFSVQPLVDCEPPGWSVTEIDIGPTIVEIPGWDPNVADGLAAGVEIVARIYVPTLALVGPVAGPMVVFVHGQTGQFSPDDFYLDFGDIARCAARNGFVFVSVRSFAEDVSASIDKTVRARHLLGATWAAYEVLTTQFGLDFEAVPGDRIAFMGHSRGGEAVGVAARLALRYELVPEPFVGAVGATIALAPANDRNEVLGEAGMPHSSVVPACLVICGSWDADVGLESAAQEYDAFHLSLWDVAVSAYKGFLAIDRTSHFSFVEGFADAGELSRPAARAVTKQYVVSFLLWRMGGDESQRCWFTGEAVPVFPPEVLGPGDDIRTRLLFRLGNEGYVSGHDDVEVAGEADLRLAVDDFEIWGVRDAIREFGEADPDLPENPPWPHGYFGEPTFSTESNYRWCAAFKWESAPAQGPDAPRVVLTVRRPDLVPFWIVPPGAAEPGAPRLVIRFDAVCFLPYTSTADGGAAIVVLVYAFDEDGESRLFGSLPVTILETPLSNDPFAAKLTLSTVLLDFADLEVFLASPPQVALDRLEMTFASNQAGGAAITAPRGWYGPPP